MLVVETSRQGRWKANPRTGDVQDVVNVIQGGRAGEIDAGGLRALDQTQALKDMDFDLPDGTKISGTKPIGGVADGVKYREVNVGKNGIDYIRRYADGRKEVRYKSGKGYHTRCTRKSNSKQVKRVLLLS